MKIIGKKHLDENLYSTVTIHDDKIYFYSCDKMPTIPSSHKFSDELKGKSDEEVIEMVIDHFLRNTKLYCIVNNEIYGVGGRKLIINVNIPSSVKRKIVTKYENDRINHFYETEEKKYNISTMESLSKYSKNKYTFATKKGKIATIELTFLKEMIEKVFAGEEIFINQDGYYAAIISNTKRIELNSYILLKICHNKIYEIVSNHNDAIINNRAMQLKLEVRR